jgi:hypothetical protein
MAAEIKNIWQTRLCLECISARAFCGWLFLARVSKARPGSEVSKGILDPEAPSKSHPRPHRHENTSTGGLARPAGMGMRDLAKPFGRDRAANHASDLRIEVQTASEEASP